MSMLTISRRWIASSHSSRSMVNGPLDRVPIRTKRGWISERSRSMSLAHKASRHWRSTDSISSEVLPPPLSATHQASQDSAQKLVAELAPDRAGDRSARRLHHLVGHARPLGLALGLPGDALLLTAALGLKPLLLALQPQRFPRGDRIRLGFLGQ